MAKTKRSEKRSKKTRSKSSRSHPIDASLLLAVLDELNELAGLLRCVPEANILSDSFRGRGHEMEENEASEKTEQTDLDHDRIATAAMEWPDPLKSVQVLSGKLGAWPMDGGHINVNDTEALHTRADHRQTA